MGMSSSVILAGSSGWKGSADVDRQPNGAREVLLEFPKSWSVLIACSRRGMDLLRKLRSLRQLGDNAEELRARVGLDVLHQDSTENSEGLAVSCAKGDVRAGDRQLPYDVQNLHTGLYILCLLSLMYSPWLTWPPAPVWVLACHGPCSQPTTPPQ